MLQHDDFLKTKLVRFIKDERASQKWTQEQLALASGVTQETISRMENERAFPRLYTLCTMIDALGFEVSFNVKEKINEENNTTMA